MGVPTGEQMPELSQNRLQTQDHLWEGPPQEVAGPLPIHLLSTYPPALLPLLAACLGGDPLGWGCMRLWGLGEQLCWGQVGMRSVWGRGLRAPIHTPPTNPHLVKLLKPLTWLWLSIDTQWS